MRRGTIRVALACAGRGATCRGAISARTVARVRLGRTNAVRAVVTSVRYTLAGGRRKTVTLRLSRAARQALLTRRALLVRITLKPARGVRAVKRVTLLR